MELLASIEEFEYRSQKELVSKGLSLLLIKTGEEYFAIENRCSHDGAGLAGGDVVNCEIECPRHGARFDLRTGNATVLPAFTPISVYPISVINGKIYLGHIE